MQLYIANVSALIINSIKDSSTDDFTKYPNWILTHFSCSHSQIFPTGTILKRIISGRSIKPRELVFLNSNLSSVTVEGPEEKDFYQ